MSEIGKFGNQLLITGGAMGLSLADGIGQRWA